MGKKLEERDLTARLEQIGKEVLKDLRAGKRRIYANKTTLELDLPFDGKEGEIYEFPEFEWCYFLTINGKGFVGVWQFSPAKTKAYEIARRDGVKHISAVRIEPPDERVYRGKDPARVDLDRIYWEY